MAPDCAGVFVGTYHASSSEAVRGEDGIGLRNGHVPESDRGHNQIRNDSYAECAASDDDRPHLPPSALIRARSSWLRERFQAGSALHRR